MSCFRACGSGLLRRCAPRQSLGLIQKFPGIAGSSRSAATHRRDPRRKAGGIVGLDRDAAEVAAPSAGSNRAEGMPVVKRRIGSSFCMPMTES